MRIKFEIPGPPTGKGRPRFARVGNYTKTYTPEETASYENLVRLMYRTQCHGFRFEDGTQLDMRIYAYFPIPKSASKKKRAKMLSGEIRPTKKPDWDNSGKIIADSLNEIAYKDDSQIVDGMVRKFYGETPKVIVVIKEAITNEQGA